MAVSFASAKAQQLIPLAINLQTTPNNTTLVLSNRLNIKEIDIAAGSGQVLLELYDQNNTNAPLWGTNYVGSNYVSVARYATNIASSFVDPGTGYTNWYTNQGIFTYNVTNLASTNALARSAAFVVQPNTAQAFNTDLLHIKGLTVRCNTNASVVVYYNPGL